MTYPTPPPHAPGNPGRAPAHATAAAPLTAADKRRIGSQSLFDGQVEIEIEHFSQVYRLRQTSLGKLILTK